MFLSDVMNHAAYELLDKQTQIAPIMHMWTTRRDSELRTSAGGRFKVSGSVAGPPEATLSMNVHGL